MSGVKKNAGIVHSEKSESIILEQAQINDSLFFHIPPVPQPNSNTFAPLLMAAFLRKTILFCFSSSLIPDVFKIFSIMLRCSSLVKKSRSHIGFSTDEYATCHIYVPIYCQLLSCPKFIIYSLRNIYGFYFIKYSSVIYLSVQSCASI